MIYIDDVRLVSGQQVACRMVADTRAELHKMAQKLGLKKSRCQQMGTRIEHYYLSMKKRELAQKLGAREVSCRMMALILAKKQLSLS